ncbi:MAG: hypothetical protein E7543_06155 [Ruminococcaceae bacterium]|nr:hypothetical protein [Oscillospiraceae bacterium]
MCRIFRDRTVHCEPCRSLLHYPSAVHKARRLCPMHSKRVPRKRHSSRSPYH